MTTTAQNIADMFDNDGRRFETETGKTLDTVCRDFLARVSYARHDTESDGEYIEESANGIVEIVRYEFIDGSAIVEAGDGWDIEGTAPFTWQ